MSQTIYFHITCSFITLLNALRLCEESTKGGFESILEIVLTLPPHSKYAYTCKPTLMHMCLQALQLHGTIHSSCLVYMTQVQVAACNTTRRQKFWGSAHEDCNQDCSSLNSFVPPEARSALCLPAQAIRSQRRAVTAKGVPSSYCPISTSP